MLDNSKKILVVDDEEGIRENMGEYLESLGFSVETAYDKDSAWKVFVSYHPDIIFMDVRMPGTDGIDLAKQFKTAREEIKIVIITGCIEDEVFDRAVDAQVSSRFVQGFIYKPFSPHEIKECLEVVIQGEKRYMNIK